jgi:hypothetical protein
MAHAATASASTALTGSPWRSGAMVRPQVVGYPGRLLLLPSPTRSCRRPLSIADEDATVNNFASVTSDMME